MEKVRKREFLGVLILVSVGLIAFFSSLFGNVEGAGEWDWLMALGFVAAGLGGADLFRADLKKTKTPVVLSESLDEGSVAFPSFHRHGRNE